jgi:Ca-activated chloride channel family protein
MSKQRLTRLTARLSAASLALGALLALAPSDALAAAVAVRTDVGTPVLLARRTSTIVLKIGLQGLALTGAEQRPPVNLSIVLDKSGSMAGDKLDKAKTAALHLLDRLRPDDLVSVIAYDSGVRVLVPTTRVADRHRISSAILGLDASGSTALFAGVSKGIGEVRRYLRGNQVNRVILLSDGQANVGPASPNALGRLGAACAKEGNRHHHHRPRPRLQRRSHGSARPAQATATTPTPPTPPSCLGSSPRSSATSPPSSPSRPSCASTSPPVYGRSAPSTARSP